MAQLGVGGHERGRYMNWAGKSDCEFLRMVYAPIQKILPSFLYLAVVSFSAFCTLNGASNVVCIHITITGGCESRQWSSFSLNFLQILVDFRSSKFSTKLANAAASYLIHAL